MPQESMSTSATLWSKPSRPSAITHEPRFTKAKKERTEELKTRGELARFWLDLLKDESNGRKIVKVPAMTYCYGATVGGMADQVRRSGKIGDTTPRLFGRKPPT